MKKKKKILLISILISTLIISISLAIYHGQRANYFYGLSQQGYVSNPFAEQATDLNATLAFIFSLVSLGILIILIISWKVTKKS